MIRTQFSVGVPSYSFVRAGTALHTGERTKAMVAAGRPGGGIRFIREDSPGKPVIPALYRHIQSSQRATTLGLGGGEVGTVEHLMAALAFGGVADADVRVTGPELPALDGSALPWVEGLKGAELWRGDTPPRRWYTLDRPFELADRGWSVQLLPSAEPSLKMSVDFEHPGVGKQMIDVSLTAEVLAKEIAPARTFGFMRDALQLTEEGLIQGVDLTCALIYDDQGQVLNPDGVRFPDEVVRHKALDFIGDLALLGAPLHARMIVHATGHAVHRNLMWALSEARVLTLHGAV